MKKCFYFLALLAFAGCKGNDDHPTETFDFLVNVNIENSRPEYQAGDTLWMNISIPERSLSDRVTGKTVSIDGVQFGFGLLPVHFFDSNPIKPIQDRIEIVASKPFNQPNADYPVESVFTFGCPGNDFTLRVGVVFKDAGRFLFLLNRTNKPTGSIKENPRSQVLIPGNGQCDFKDISGSDIALVEYVYGAADYNQADFEAFMASLIADPQNWDPESTQKTLNDMKVVFANGAAFFATVK